MLGTVLAFQLPRAIVLCILPASVELVNFLLGLRLNLHKNKRDKQVSRLKQGALEDNIVAAQALCRSCPSDCAKSQLLV